MSLGPCSGKTTLWGGLCCQALAPWSTWSPTRWLCCSGSRWALCWLGADEKNGEWQKSYLSLFLRAARLRRQRDVLPVQEKGRANLIVATRLQKESYLEEVAAPVVDFFGRACDKAGAVLPRRRPLPKSMTTERRVLSPSARPSEHQACAFPVRTGSRGHSPKTRQPPPQRQAVLVTGRRATALPSAAGKTAGGRSRCAIWSQPASSDSLSFNFCLH